VSEVPTDLIAAKNFLDFTGTPSSRHHQDPFRWPRFVAWLPVGCLQRTAAAGVA
jgi:hypothetical protein